jgi:hypothetical protein
MKYTLLVLLLLSGFALTAQVQPCVRASSVEFNNVSLGDSAALDLYITNSCGQNATLTSYDSSVVEQFTGPNGPIFRFVNFPYGHTITPNDSVSFTVWYFPQQSGVRNCLDVRVFGDAPTSSIQVCGSSMETTSQPEHNQTDIYAGIRLGYKNTGVSLVLTVSLQTNNDEVIILRLVDVLGHAVSVGSLSLSPVQHEAEIDLSALDVRAGLYFVVATSAHGLVSLPCVIP